MADNEQTQVPAAPALTGTILDYSGHSEEARASADPNAKPYKEGRPAEHEVGVQWIGPWEQRYDGFAKHTRLSARAVASAGVPVHLRGLDPKESNDEVSQEEVYDLLTASIRNYEIRVVQIVPDVQAVGRWVFHKGLNEDDSAARNRATIMYTVWERENIDPSIVAMMSRAGQLWVACERNARALVASGANAESVHVVPVPFLPSDPAVALQTRARFPGVHRFLHIGKWEPRKAQDKLLHGFMLAFSPGEAELIIKTSKFAPAFSGYPADPANAIEHALYDEGVKARGWTKANVSPSIRMVRDSLTDSQIVSLHNWADTYCTVSHGEGFDMPAFTAALAGRRLVYTQSGGPEDFVCNDDILVEPTGSEPVDPWYDWEPSATWTAVDVNNIADALRRAVGTGTNRVKRDLSRFTLESVGRQMRDLLEKQANTFGRSVVEAR